MSEGERPRPVLVLLLALLPVLAAYANALEVGFMWDDRVLIEQNTDLHQLRAPWEYLGRSFWQHPFARGEGHVFYRPLVSFSLALDWWLGGGAPLSFHLTNVGLHLVVCALVFSVARALGATAPAAGIGAALFGVMPRLTESVTWIVGRTDVLATLLVLGALLVEHRPPRARWTPWAVAGLVLLALLSKEVALCAVLLLVGRSVLRWRSAPQPRRHLALELAPLGLAVAAWLVLRSQVAASPLGAAAPRGDVFFGSLGHFLHMLLTPWRPMALIGFVQEPEPWAQGLGVVFLVVLGGSVAWLLRRRRPELAAWALSAAAGVLLVAAMVAVVALPVYPLAADRFLYLPLALLAVLAAQARWSPLPLVVAALAVGGLAWVTTARNALWADELRFWQETARTAHPKHAGAFAGLGDAYFELARLEEARGQYARAEAVRPPQADSPTRLALAVVDSRLGHDAAALAQLEAILREVPDWRRAAYAEVRFRARALDFAGARRALERNLARWGEDAALRSLRALLDRTEPVLTSSDAAPSARALALHELGATAKAEVLFAAVLQDDAHQQAAAQWLVIFGTEPRARAALEVLGDEPGAKATFEERFR